MPFKILHRIKLNHTAHCNGPRIYYPNAKFPEGGMYDARFFPNLFLGDMVELKGPVGHFIMERKGPNGYAAWRRKKHVIEIGLVCGESGIHTCSTTPPSYLDPCVGWLLRIPKVWVLDVKPIYRGYLMSRRTRSFCFGTWVEISSPLQGNQYPVTGLIQQDGFPGKSSWRTCQRQEKISWFCVCGLSPMEQQSVKSKCFF